MIEHELWINGDKQSLRTLQDFYEAIDFLHTAALDSLPDAVLAPVLDALEQAMVRVSMIEGVKP